MKTITITVFTCTCPRRPGEPGVHRTCEPAPSSAPPPWSAGYALRVVLDGLPAGKPYEHWLPIFDNADDPATMRG